MPHRQDIDRVWQIIEKVGICMLTTQFESGLRARPLEARPDRDSDQLRFITDRHSAKKDEIDRWPHVGLIFVDAGAKAYVSITGKAQIVHDPSLRSVAWRESDAVWWPGGPNDPNVCVLVVHPIAAELWDGPASSAVAAYEFAKARATGAEPNLGENRKVTVDMKE
jgi:general stress protein 26